MKRTTAFESVPAAYAKISRPKPIVFRQGEKNFGIKTNLPTDAVQWSSGRNFRFRSGCAYEHPGRVLITTVPDGNPVLKIFRMGDLGDVVEWQIVVTTAHVYAYYHDFAAYYDVTPATFIPGFNWSLTITGGLPVLSNEFGHWQWPAPPSAFSAMPGPFNPPVGAVAAVNFDRRLFTIGNEIFKGRLNWSGIANPTHNDQSPDPALEADYGRAGQQDLILNRQGDSIMESGKALATHANNLYVFTDRRIWTALRFTPPHDYAVAPLIFDHAPLAASKCVVPVDTPHAQGVAYMGLDDFYLLNGLGVVPIGEDIKNVCFPNLNRTNIENSFGFYNPATMEVFFNVPTGKNRLPDTSFIYHTVLKNWAIADCNVTCQSVAVMQRATAPVVQLSWQDSTASWLNLPAGGVLPYSVLGDSQGNLWRMDASPSDNGKAITCRLETGDFGTGIRRLKFARVFLNFRTSGVGSNVFVQFGARDSTNEPVDWDPPERFVVGQDKYIRSNKSGFFLKMRIYSQNANFTNILSGYSIEHSFLGGS